MITLIAIAQIADLLNENRDRYSPRAESEFYESFGNSRVVRLAAFLMSPRLGGKTLRSRRAKPCRSEHCTQAARLARS